MKPGTICPGMLPPRYPRISEFRDSPSSSAATCLSCWLSACCCSVEAGSREMVAGAGSAVAALSPFVRAGPAARTAAVTCSTTLTHLPPSEAETQEKWRRRGSSPTNSIRALKVAKRRRAKRLPCT